MGWMPTASCLGRLVLRVILDRVESCEKLVLGLTDLFPVHRVGDGDGFIIAGAAFRNVAGGFIHRKICHLPTAFHHSVTRDTVVIGRPFVVEVIYNLAFIELQRKNFLMDGCLACLKIFNGVVGVTCLVRLG